MAALEAADKFAALCKIARAQHFAWRAAVGELCGEAEAAAVVARMWEITGDQTAAAYVPRLDPEKPLAPQVAKSVVWSSRCMGEDAHLEVSEDGDVAFVRHEACPWFDLHKRLGLLEEDRAGCDCWFSTTVAGVNRALGTALRVETLSTLPDGDAACVRRFWVESDG